MTTTYRCYGELGIDVTREKFGAKMLTVMCPNCRHRFPAPGCCEPSSMTTDTGMIHPDSGCYYGGFLVPRGYTSGGGCIINAPTIVHGPAVIQTGNSHGSPSATIVGTDLNSRNQTPNIRVTDGTCSFGHGVQKDYQTTKIFVDPSRSPDNPRRMRNIFRQETPKCHITTTCDLTGGSVTITTPSIQSGGCLIQSTDSGVLVQAPQIEIRPKLSGGGCLIQKRLSTEDQETVEPILIDDEDLSESRYVEDLNLTNSCYDLLRNHSNEIPLIPPSGCQELPGTRRSTTPKTNNEQERSNCSSINGHCCCEEEKLTNLEASSPEIQIRAKVFGRNDCQSMSHHREHAFRSQMSVPTRKSNCCCNNIPKTSCCCGNPQNLYQSQVKTNQHNNCNISDRQCNGESIDPAGGVQIQVNATVQIPASLRECTVNITATTNTSGPTENSTRSRNNFNGGGLVRTQSSGVEVPESSTQSDNNNERRYRLPATPVSWLVIDPSTIEREKVKLNEVRRLLQVCGWYYEGLSWQQSESLLKDAPVGRWLMRDSSDSRYTFAISVQTARGPTSVRVNYLLGLFYLDAEPGLPVGMSVFDCPIKMLEYYVEYSKRVNEDRREVWVDYSGQLYSHINLTKPLIREVRPLSHLARLVVNRNKIPTDHLPPVIKNYLADYPYTF